MPVVVYRVHQHEVTLRPGINPLPPSPLSPVCPHLSVWPGSARPGPFYRSFLWNEVTVVKLNACHNYTPPNPPQGIRAADPQYSWHAHTHMFLQHTHTPFPIWTGSEVLIMSASSAVRQRADATAALPGVTAAGLRGEAMSKIHCLNRPGQYLHSYFITTKPWCSSVRADTVESTDQHKGVFQKGRLLPVISLWENLCPSLLTWIHMEDPGVLLCSGQQVKYNSSQSLKRWQDSGENHVLSHILWSS